MCFAQMWVYEDADEDGAPNLYVHHDIILPAFPLSLAWMDCHLSDSSQTANLAAVRARIEILHLVISTPSANVVRRPGRHSLASES